MWERLCNAMGRPELADDPRYAKPKARDDHRAEVNGIVSDWVRGLDSADVLAACEAAEAPASKLLSIADIFADPQYAARGNLQTLDDPRVGALTLPGPMPRMSRTPPELRTAGPALGSANSSVLGGLLGIEADTLADFARRGII